jgi:LCP family protein required for cell wall assembly
MAKKAKKPSERDNFDIHRTLPARGAKVLRLSARNTPLEDVAEITPEEKKRGFSFKRAIASLLLLVFLFFLTIAAWEGIELSRATNKMFGSGNLFSLIFGNDLKTDDNGRVNILLAGYSADDPGHQGAQLTDSIMLISLNRTDKTGYMLSIPRDLYVKIPGKNDNEGYGKINEAYEQGIWQNFNDADYPPGGMGMLDKVVSENLSVNIQYYSLINYAAFRDTVNAVGGITINIKSPDPRGIYDPSTDYTSATCCALAKYPNGPAFLNGKDALNLARARGDAYGSYGFGQADFDRTEHQRQMLLALRQKAVSTRNVLNPTRSGHLFDGMANNVKTDIDIGAALPLYRLFNAVNAGNLKSLSLRDLNGKNYLTDYSGALIPTAGFRDFSDIQTAIQKLNQ